jgi:hypothetical protein
MNPWLEDARLWRDVHQSLITALRDVLAPQLEPRYFVAVETHTYISAAPTQAIRSRYPDASVLRIGEAAPAYTLPPAEAIPLVIDLPLPEPYEEPYLEVRLLPEGEVITVIELLSHTNKRAGDERRSYAEKRTALIDSAVHFIEIDLLRAYAPMPFTEHVAADYRIFVRRRELGRRALLYAFMLRQPIPTFSLPLLPGDREPLVDLGAVLHDLYDRARYKLVIDYHQPPAPPLDEVAAAWAQECASTMLTPPAAPM